MKCIVCHERKATVPDRDRQSGRLINRVCSQCHAQRLIGDLKQVLKAVNEDRFKCNSDIEKIRGDSW